MGLFAIGLIITTILSIHHKVTSSKNAMAGALAVMLLLRLQA